MSRRRASTPTILAFSGASGSGKTSLLVKLIPALRSRGLAVCALKHSGHPHSFDARGKDSARLRRAGALAVALQGPAELAWFGPPVVGGIRALARLLPRVDLIVAEGFKDEPVPRIEVHRSEVAEGFLCRRDPRVVAVVSDEEPPRRLPWFTAGEVEALADFVARFTRSGGQARGRALASPGARAHRMAGAGSPPRETRAMVRTGKKSGEARGRRGTGRTAGRAVASTRRVGRRGGGATVREAGRKGGRRTLERRGPEFYSRIGRKGGKSSGTARRNAARARRGATSRARGVGRRTGRGHGRGR